MSLGILSASTFHRIQRHYVSPVVFSAWSAQQHVIIQEMKERSHVHLAGDARCDSPGFSAKYSTYTLMDCETQYIICGRVVQLGQEAHSSVGMEKIGLKSCLDYVLHHSVPVTVLATDRSPSIINVMKTDYSHINHQHDIWHLSKSLKKKILAVSKKKSTCILNEWLRSIINHLYYSVQNCDKDENKLIELWLSELNHIRGIHQWVAGSRFQTVLACIHDDVDAKLASDGLQKAYLQSDSEAFTVLESIVNAPPFLSALRHCTLALSTYSLENVHSVMLKYVPKRLHFSFLGMNLRTCLAYLDHNYNIQRGKNRNTYKYQYSKVSGKWIARETYAPKEYSWRKELLQDAVTLRLFGISPPDCDPPFGDIPFPRNIAPVPMPAKEALNSSRTENTRRINSS